ncbi:UNVERIFIED_CONTAM: hypothetical protein ABIC26_000345 [Paenibacillus sp. PvR008]
MVGRYIVYFAHWRRWSGYTGTPLRAYYEWIKFTPAS